MHLDAARRKRGFAVSADRAFLEERILRLLGHLDDSPEVSDEILNIRNRIWLLDAASGKIGWPD